MTDYHPLIARAVAGLDKNTGDARRGLYERARTALVAQLRGVVPALSESDVTRERLALEEAIRKVEAETVRQARTETPRAPPAPKMRPPEMPSWEEREPAAAPTQLRRNASTQPERAEPTVRRPMPAARQGNAATAAATPMLGEQPYIDPVFDQPLPTDLDAPRPLPPAPPPTPTPAPAPARHALRGRAPGDRRSLLDAGLKDFRNVVAETNDLGEASAWAAKSARDHYGADRLAAPEPELSEPMMIVPQASHPSPQELAPAQMLDQPYADEEARPGSSKQTSHDDGDALEGDVEAKPARSNRHLIRLAAVLVIIAGLAGLVVWLWPNVEALYRVAWAPAAETAQDAAPSGRPKITDRIEPGGQPSQPAQVTALGPGTPAPGAAVAQRVVLYEEDPNDPNGKRFVGSAIWRTETVTPGPGQTPDLAIRADVEIPERKLSMTWSLRRNTDPGLPASHTVEIVFKLPADFVSGGVDKVPGILMKQAEQARGVPLAGLAVKVTNGFFLIGLSASDADRDRNLQLLKERSWFDIPVVYNNSRRAILALEKGTPGERVFAEAFAAWRQ